MANAGIVTTGKIIKIQCGSFYLERTSEAPGIVTLRTRTRGEESQTITLPANPGEMENLIAAYRRAVAEEVGYRESKFE